MISNEDFLKFKKLAENNIIPALEVHLVKLQDLYGLLYVVNELYPSYEVHDIIFMAIDECNNSTTYISGFCTPEQFLLLLEGKIEVSFEVIQRLR